MALFPYRVISRFGDDRPSSRLLELSICDFFLWGYLKSRIHETKLRTPKDLKIQSVKKSKKLAGM